MVIPWCFSIFFGLNVASGDGAITLDEFTKLVQSPKLKSLGLLSNEPISQGLVNEYIYIHMGILMYIFLCLYVFFCFIELYVFICFNLYVCIYVTINIYIYRLQYIYIYIRY
jgi:hypothetical protein